MNLELSDQEVEVLRDLLRSEYSELGGEIANTDSADYRGGLKKKRAVTKAILERLEIPSH